MQSNNVPDWPDAVRMMADDAWTKIVDDVNMAVVVKDYHPQGNVLIRFWRDWMQQFGLDWEWNKERARQFITTWLNESFFAMLDYIDAIEDFNEYWAASHTADETAARVMWIQALLTVWHKETLPKHPQLRKLRWVLGNAAVGNDMPWQVAQAACDYGHMLGYHGYISVYGPTGISYSLRADVFGSNTTEAEAKALQRVYYRANFRIPRDEEGAPSLHLDQTPYFIKPIAELDPSFAMAQVESEPTPGERSPGEWTWGSGRILAYDKIHYAPRGLAPEYVFTECGLVRDANGKAWLQPNDGWRHSKVANGDMDKYNRLIGEVDAMDQEWNAANDNRLRGRAYFTSGANDWDDFDLQTPDLKKMFTFTNTLPGDEMTPLPTEEETHGIDVNHNQGDFDWTIAGNRDDVDFVFAKASDGKYITNSPWFTNPIMGHVDHQYANNIEGALKNGISLVGAFHYFQPAVSAALQFSYFKAAIESAQFTPTLPPVLDLEEHPPSGQIAKMQTDIKSILDDMEFYSGYRPIIYTNASYYNRYLANTEWADTYPLWIANYGNIDQPYMPSTLEQDSWEFWRMVQAIRTRSRRRTRAVQG
jgi:lysozyme